MCLALGYGKCKPLDTTYGAEWCNQQIHARERNVLPTNLKGQESDMAICTVYGISIQEIESRS